MTSPLDRARPWRRVPLFSGSCDASTAHVVRQRLRSMPGAPLPADLVGDCQLIATELVTNALNAQAAEVDVELRVLGNELELRVRDTADGVPQPRRTSPTDTGGRGLGIIDAIASAWGYRSEPDEGKTVWARLGASGRPDRAWARPG